MALLAGKRTFPTASVCFRADASSTIGLGHLVRSKALADVLARHGSIRGAQVSVAWCAKYTAASSSDAGNHKTCVDKVLGREFGTNDLPLSPHAPSCTLSEADKVAAWALEQNAAWLVVDHYDATEEYLAQLKKRFSSNESGAVQILLLDDHQVRGVGLVQCRLAPMQDSAADTLAGVQYLLMRPEFGTLASASKSASERQGWLLCLGGADTKNITSRCIELLMASKGTGTTEPLVVLASDRMAEAQGLDPLLKQWPGSTAIRESWVGPAKMASLLKRAKAAIVSCSGVATETLAMGCPMVGVCWEENQVKHRKVISDAGVPTVTNPEEACTALVAGEASTGILAIDPFGAWRVAGKMLSKTPIEWGTAALPGTGRTCTLRQATMDDAAALSPSCSMAVLARNAFSYPRLLVSTDKDLLVWDSEGVGCVGAASVAWRDEAATPEVQVFILPGHRRQGYGRLLWDTLVPIVLGAGQGVVSGIERSDHVAQKFSESIGMVPMDGGGGRGGGEAIKMYKMKPAA